MEKEYDDPVTGDFHAVSTAVEGEYYLRKNRLEEIVIFARRMRYRRLGIAFCVGFSREAEILAGLLEKAGFEVSSVCCKICAIMKDERGLQKIDPNREEAICNPVGQARALQEDRTDLNIVLGLCVGHDSLFYRYSAAPVTTLVTKDRVLGHNPVAVLYSPYLCKKISADLEE